MYFAVTVFQGEGTGRHKMMKESVLNKEQGAGKAFLVPVNFLILSWFTGIGGYIADIHWLTGIAILVSVFMIIIWLAGVTTGMFGRKSGKGVSSSETVREMQKTQLSESPENIGRRTVIGCDASVNGMITDSGDVDVYGRFSGDIILTEGCVEVMCGGYVEGNLRATEVVINGKVKGRCEGRSVCIMEHGWLEGDCCSAELVIHQGGHFVGTSEVCREEYNKDICLVAPSGIDMLVE